MDYSTRKSGFTMIELLVTIGIVAILSSVSFISLGTYRKKQNIERTLDEVVAAVQSTQKRSVTQEGGYAWGMRFENNTTSHTYEIFKGSTYASSTSMSKLGLSRALQLMNPYASSTFDALFAPITGALSSKKVISMGTGRADSYVGDLVLSTLGRVTKRVEEGVVGYWHFDESTSTVAYDASGRGNNGTLTNGPARQSESNCKAGGCLGFDTALQKYVTVPDNTSTDIRTNLTLSAWIYPTGVGGSDSYSTVLYGNSSGYYLSFNDALRALSCYWYGRTPPGYHTTSADTVPLNQWTHVACVWDASNVKNYINGVLVKTTAVTGAGTGVSNLNMGAESVARQFQGYIDEVRLYGRTLDSDEILNHYNDLK